jgi:hypothetical protein
MVVWSLVVVGFDFGVCKESDQSWHGSHDRLLHSSCILAILLLPPELRRFFILNGLFYFLDYKEIFPCGRPPLFNLTIDDF